MISHGGSNTCMHTSRYVPLTLNKYHKVKHTVPVPEKQAVTLTLY